MADSTLSDVFQRPARPTGALVRECLVLLFRGGPLTRPSRHVVDDVGVVRIGRGPESATRVDDADRRRVLELRIPDAMISTDHARLTQHSRGWLIEDLGSKNGTFVDGVHVGSGYYRRALIQIGHSVLRLDRLGIPTDAPLDGAVEVPPDPFAAFATFDHTLAAQLRELGPIAAAPVAVLLRGETGTGKEVMARAIHAASGRPGSFVAVNCGAIPAALVESELFGHRKGAFSGAVADRLGHVRTADRGTLFLDEVGELPAAAQVALLRVLQDHEVVPIGESLPARVDLRVVAATHRDLSALVAEGRFREDLYARLLGATVALPPLRLRRADLGILTAELLARLGAGAQLTPAAMLAITRYDWPRNVRELERALAGAYARTGGAPIDAEHLPAEVTAVAAGEEASRTAAESAPPPLSAEEQVLRQQIVAALIQHEGNVTSAAKELGKHREQLHRWAKRFGIDLESFRR